MLVGKCLCWRIHLPMQEIYVRSLGQEDFPRKEMATCFRFLSRESHGQRSLAGYSPWGCKESDMTECVHGHTHTHTHTQTQMSALGSVFGMKVRKDWSITLHPLQSCPWPPYPTVASRRPHRGCLLLHEGPLHSSALVASLQTVWSVVKGEPEAGVKQDGDLSQGTNWWYISSDGPAHHWRSIRVWINKGRDRWNCWGGRFQLAAQDHFLLAEAVKLWLWPGSLIWRPSAFLDSPLAVVEWARVRMRGSFQWPPGCW